MVRGSCLRSTKRTNQDDRNKREMIRTTIESLDFVAPTADDPEPEHAATAGICRSMSKHAQAYRPDGLAPLNHGISGPAESPEDTARRLARKILLAMREATDVMIDAALRDGAEAGG